MTTLNMLRIAPRLIMGSFILAVGVLWTLDNIDVLDADRLLEFWPAALILIGVVRLLDPMAAKAPSGVLIILGTALLLANLDVIDIRFWDLIPLGVAMIGAKLIWDVVGRTRDASTSIPAGDTSETIHAFAMMAGLKRQSTTHEFRGGDANAIMGGVELDLRDARMGDGEEAILDTFAFWGGIEIKVPENWRVVGRVLPLLGGFEDNTTHKNTTGPLLIVQGTAIMGAVEVKN